MEQRAIDDDAPRALWPSIRRGWFGRCPSCGEGRMLFGLVKVRDHCLACDEPLHHHRADDMPPYVTIMIVGHIIVPLVLMAEKAWAPETWVHWVVWLPLTALLSVILLPRVKGSIIGIQWAHRMHGFGGEPDLPVEP